MSFGDLKVQDLIYEDASNNEITVVIADLATKNNPSFTGNATGVNLTLSGNLTVNGTTTTINTTTLLVEDKNIEIGKVASPSDTTADGGGWTLLGSTSKTFNWLNATDSWTSSEHIEIVSGKNLKVDGTTLFVDGTNNKVGIGTISPNRFLTVVGDNTNVVAKFSSTDANASIEFADDSGTAEIGCTSNDLHFSPGGAEKARIDSIGRFMIATAVRNNVSNNADDIIIGDLNTSNETGLTISSTAGSSIRFNDNAGYAGGLEYAHGDDSLRFSSGAAERMRIDSSGRVLIGTTQTLYSPADDLVIGTGSGDRGLCIYSGSSDTGLIVFADGTSDPAYRVGQILYDHSGNTMSFRVNGNTERLRIASSGQIGIGGANYGTSGQVLTSGGSGAAPSWANPAAGGNTFTAVADGAIATDKQVKIKTNGKVEQIKQTLTGGNPADDNANEVACGTADAGNNSWFIYDPDQDKLVSFYTATYANNNLRYSVMAITSYNGKANNGPISGSSDLGVESTARVNGAYEWGSVCYDTNNNKYIIAFRCRNDDNVYVGAGTYNTSNNSITWPSGKSNWTQPNGSENHARIPTLYFDETTNRIVLLMRDDTNSDRPYVVIGTYNSSSGSIDWGTKQVLDTTDIRDNNTVICKGGSGTGEVFIGYKASTTALKGNLITVSSSSNTCTIQTSATIQASATAFRADYNAEDGNILLAYQDTTNNQGKLIRLTKNSGGTGFDKSSALTFCLNNQASFWDVHYFSTAKKIYVFYRKSASDRKSYGFVVTNTSGTPTKGSDAGSIGNNADIWMGHTAHSNKNVALDRIFQPYTENSNARCYVEGWTSLSATSNQTSSTKHQYVGYVDQAYSDGQTATIITYGNTKSGLSGLTIGTKYYVSQAGTLSTSDSSLGVAGVALAADKLLVKDPL